MSTNQCLPTFLFARHVLRPCMHFLHVPWHRWLQLSKTSHGIWHRDRSSSENGSKTRTDHKRAHKLFVVKQTTLCLENTNDARCEGLNTVLPRSQLSQNVMLCHWVNNFLKHYHAFIQAQAFLLELFNLWRWRRYKSSKWWEILAHWQCQTPEDLKPQQWTQE